MFLTIALKLAASTVAAVYKDRWQIEFVTDQNVCGDQRQFSKDADLDGVDRAAGDQVFADEGEL